MIEKVIIGTQMDIKDKHNDTRKLIIEFPTSLYEQLTAWKKQHSYVTDAEAIRSLIRDGIKSDGMSQSFSTK